jgi:urease subunit gamma/beta
MNLTPTELERLLIFQAAEFARRNLAANVKLSHPEAVALITDEMMHAARRGVPYEAIIDMAAHLLDPDQVAPGVPPMIPVLCVEGSFPEGTKVMVVFQPIAISPDGLVPGEVIQGDGDVEMNRDRPTIEVAVTNTGDRDVQVRSHAHFFEVNRALDFDRERAFGMRLNKPSGVGVRFEPGIRKIVELVPYAGNRYITGFGGLTNGAIDDPEVKRDALAAARARGYRGV